MKTPQVVKDNAKFFLDMGAKLSHVGEYNGYEVFLVCFPEDWEIGLPHIFMYKEGEPVLACQGYAERYEADVLDIIDATVRSTRERRKATHKARGQEKLF